MAPIRYAIRTLVKSPGFVLVAIATIALGIAANTAIFSVVNGVLLRPLPFRDEARVVKVSATTRNGRESNHSAGDFLDIRRGNRSLEAIAGFRDDFVAVATPPREPLLFPAAWVTAEFFDVLGTPAALGRPFLAADNAAGQKIAVIGHAVWQRLLNGDPGAVGRAVRVNGESYTVAAVMPAEFAWPQQAKIWLLSPLPVPPSPINLKDPLTNRDVQYFQGVARLKADVTLDQAREDLRAVAAAIQQAHPASSGRAIRIVPVRETLVGGVREALLVIQGAVGLVLLIACANVSSLLIARAAGRRRELAVRAALGASRAHLIRQLLAESLVLGVAGGIVGLLLSAWLVVLLLQVLPRGLPRTDAIRLDTTVMFATLAASLVTGVLFGILPALQASRTQAAQVIKESGERGSARARGRAALVVAEIALTLVLLAGAGLLANSFLRLQRVDPGFDPDQVTIAHLLLPQSRYRTSESQAQLYRQLLEGLAERPELRAVGAGFPGPFRAGSASGSFDVEGRPAPSPGDRPFAYLGTVSGGYFEAMGIPVLAGRTFSDRDVDGAPGVTIVSAALARRYWPGENPIGRRLKFDDDPSSPWITVVGLVGDARQLGLAAEPPPILYFPYEQFVLPFTSVAVRSALPQATVASMLRSQLAAIDPDLPFGDIVSLQSAIENDVDGPRFRATLIGIFALLALVLAAVGVFGLISYTVAQRTREIGIRVALGAAPRQVLLPVVREGLVLALAGIAIGLAGAFLAARALSAFLFGVGAADPATFAGVALVMLIVATLASYIPSRRALQVDPVVALRAE
ncbi:MAG TPA: ABC transporter permease [Vicinamibacterales bacterium]|nr:ABC transporter permease [Vicinamibacterales bacterium]